MGLRHNLGFVMAHEIGHTLGLNHSENPNAVMYAGMNNRAQYTFLGPQRDDLRGIRALYGKTRLDRGNPYGRAVRKGRVIMGWAYDVDRNQNASMVELRSPSFAAPIQVAANRDIAREGGLGFLTRDARVVLDELASGVMTPSRNHGFVVHIEDLPAGSHSIRVFARNAGPGRDIELTSRPIPVRVEAPTSTPPTRANP